MKWHLKQFFYWSKQDRLGIILLSIILALLALTNTFYKQIFYSKPEGWSADSLNYYVTLLDSLETDLKLTEAKTKETSRFKTNRKKGLYKPIIYFPFDPDTMSNQNWVDFGFSQKQARVINNFKLSIGGFKGPEDLSKCFVISQEKIKEMTPFMAFKSKEPEIRSNKDKAPIEINPFAGEVKNEELFIPLELNSADSVALLSIKGIGPYFAGKITAYKNQLGGFVNTDQLLEIWLVDSQKLKIIAPQIRIDTLLIARLPINRITAKELKNHPYFNWNLSNAIISYRNQHGLFQSKKDLKKVKIVSDSLLIRLGSYLSFE